MRTHGSRGHRRRDRTPGYTLVELASVLVLLAVTASAFAPGARRLVDRAAVVSGREEVVRALTRARAAAVSSGGSSVTVIARPPVVRISEGSVPVRVVPLGDDRLTVRLTGSRDSTTFVFDALGIGRFANGTVVLQRGDAEAGLTVSSYGRVRRW